MKKILICLMLYFFIYQFVSTTFAQLPDRKGWWKFDDPANLTKAEIGNDLVLAGTQQAVDGPEAGNGAVKIGVGSYYEMNHGMNPSLGASVNEYSLCIDFKVTSINKWHCFFQTNPINGDDGDCFINTSGNIGVAATGYSTYSVKANEWYKLVVSVKNGTQYKCYLDGQLLLDGSVQSIDGRFSLKSNLLVFADNDGEDAEIYCSEISIWDKALTENEISSLGGYGHQIGTPKVRQLLLVPYLQNPSSTSMFICWHDTSFKLTRVEYGTTSTLGQTTDGSSEVIAKDYRWHTVHLTGLQPNTEYFYKAVSGSGSSLMYNFKTEPDSNYKGKIRFLLLSDTHNGDTTTSVKVIKAAKKKLQQLFGNDIQNHINFVLHSGDLVVDGSNIEQWTEQYFALMSLVSPNIPFLTVTGNHEGESQNYYKYMNYNDISGYPPPSTFAEKFWSKIIVNTMFIGLNSNLTGTAQSVQTTWLEQKLKEAESNTKIDFVFIINHHFPITELWVEGITEGGSPSYVANQVIPILKKYSKVIQLSYGHTHGFERGTIESEDQNGRGDFRIVCGGGGGGDIDRWGVYKNYDYPNIHVALDNFCYQVIEIDDVNKTFESTMYSLGNTGKPRDNEVMDKWYVKLNQPAPEKPSAFVPEVNTSKIIFSTSKISGDSLMTVRIQVSETADFSTTAIDTMITWKDIYKVDASLNPIDRNKGFDLTKLSFDRSKFKNAITYFYRVRYRDHNLKWSEWSAGVSFNTPTKVIDEKFPTGFILEQNYPNPFNPATSIEYSVPSIEKVTLDVYDILGRKVATLVNKVQQAGSYNIQLSTNNIQLTSGIYFYRLTAGNYSASRKMILMK